MTTQRLIKTLPAVRGRLAEETSLARLTWFRVGGPAEILFRPADNDDLMVFLAALPVEIPVTVIGVGSNILVRDGGISGVVVRLGDGFSKINVHGENILAGAGASNLRIANEARNAGLTGFEFLSGIPGSLGGSLAMNAGAFNAEMADITRYVVAVDAHGALRRIQATDIGFSYRRSDAGAGLIFVAAELQGKSDNKDTIAARMADIQEKRGKSQPLKTPTGGSTFINPKGYLAWKLIDGAGCRGLKRGGAMVSKKHCNFLVNTGDASAADLETLGEEVRRRVMEQSGICLEWEIRILGIPGEPPQEMNS
ncbi:MAG: UDP-N-acetylmuramate dehydrogenase [Pseudomonadota bacterium]|nr:UDP-N-acetylmuramate dehydrogenase [Pseudomonadota bacterium]